MERISRFRAVLFLALFAFILVLFAGKLFVLQIVDRRAASTAMAVLGVVKAAAAIAGTALGGSVIDAYGVTALTTGVGLLILVLATIFTAACFLGRVLWKKPFHSEKSETLLL